MLIAGKTFRTITKDPAQPPGLLANYRNSAVAMMAVMTTMMDSGIGRNHRTSQNNECNGSK